MDEQMLKEALKTELERVFTIIELLKKIGTDYCEFNEMLDTGSDLLAKLDKDLEGSAL